MAISNDAWDGVRFSPEVATPPFQLFENQRTTEPNDPEKSCFGCFLAFSWNIPRFRGVKVFLEFRCIWYYLVGPRLSSPSGTLSTVTLDVVKAVGIV